MIEPVADPPPDPKAQTSSKKTIVWWVVLLLIGVAVYQVLSNEPRAVHHEATDRSGFPVLSFVTWTVPLLVVGWFIWALRGNNAFSSLMQPGIDALRRGDFSAAIPVFEQMTKRYAGKMSTGSHARYHLGLAYYENGEHEKALDALAGVERWPAMLAVSNVRLVVAQVLTQIYAVRGDMRAAERWLAVTEERLAKHPGFENHFTAALVAARKGDETEFQRQLASTYPRELTLDQFRTLWLLAAYLADRRTTVRDAATVDEYVTRVRLTGRKLPLQFLGGEWPELRAFADAHFTPAA